MPPASIPEPVGSFFASDAAILRAVADDAQLAAFQVRLQRASSIIFQPDVDRFCPTAGQTSRVPLLIADKTSDAHHDGFARRQSEFELRFHFHYCLRQCFKFFGRLIEKNGDVVGR